MPPGPRISRDVRAVLTAIVVLVGIATLIGNDVVSLLLGLIVFVLMVVAMFRMPISSSMMCLLFLVIVLPNPAEGVPSKFDPPFLGAGAVLLDHLNTVKGAPGLPVALIEILFAILFVVWLTRPPPSTPRTPKIMIRLAQLSLAAIAFTWVSGLVRGGDFGQSLWQVTAVMYVPIVFLLFQTDLRGPADAVPFAKIVLTAATYKSFLALFIMSTQMLPSDQGPQPPPYATAHADSMVFACGFVIVVVIFLEKASRRAMMMAAIFLPIISIGIAENNRRLAWVEVGLALAGVYLLGKQTRLKKRIQRTLLLSAPILAIYIFAGWNSGYGKLFKPVRVIRTVVDAKSDSSSEWREFENTNIIATFRINPIIGSGFGRPYVELIQMPAVDYSLERYIPHNSLLGLWAYCGYVGFCGLTLLWASGFYFSVRSYHFSKEPQQRAAALVCFGSITIYMLHCWGDLGLATWTGIFMTGSSLAMAGKLVVTDGQWQEPGRKVRARIG